MNVPIKVLLVQLSHKNRIREPVGLVYLATVLQRREIDVHILCGTHQHPIEPGSLVDKASDFDVIGFSATTPTFEPTLKMAEFIRKKYPAKCIVLGGYHATMAYQYIMENHPVFDAVVYGEGEVSFIEYLDLRFGTALPNSPIQGVSYRVSGKVVIGPPRPVITELDSLPIPDWNLLKQRNDFPQFYDAENNKPVPKLYLMSSRGCPGKCTFCSIIKFYGKNRIRYHSVERVLNEVRVAMLENDVRFVHFCDDYFLSSASRAEKIFEGLHKLNSNLEVKISSRADQINRLQEKFPAFIRYGLREIEVGIENGAQTVLDRYGKSLTVKDNIKAITILKKLKLRSIFDFIMFDPWTTPDELETNFEFLKAYFPKAYPFGEVVSTRLMLLPGTKLYDIAIASNLYSGNPNCFPKPIFKNSDVGEIYSFVKICIKEWKRRMESEAGLTDPASYSAQSQAGPFAFIIKNRAPLILLGNLLKLKKGYRNAKMPISEIKKIKSDFISSMST